MSGGALSRARDGAAAVACLALLVLAAAQPHAQTLERVHRDHAVQCGAVERPGFAPPLGGMAGDLCRAIAEAVAGPGVRAGLHVFDADAAIAIDGADVLFLSGEEIASHGLAAAIVPGPPVFFEQLALLVPAAASAERAADLAGRVVCFMTGSRAQQAVEATLGDLRPQIARLAFREDVEMLDAFNAGRCDAMADEATTLAARRQARAINQRPSRLLPEPLDILPLFVATPREDGPWAADVAWAIGAILSAGPPLPWRPEWRAAADGMRPDWRAPAYADIYARSFGPLALPAGPNRPWPLGLFTSIAP